MSSNSFLYCDSLLASTTYMSRSWILYSCSFCFTFSYSLVNSFNLCCISTFDLALFIILRLLVILVLSWVIDCCFRRMWCSVVFSSFIFVVYWCSDVSLAVISVVSVWLREVFRLERLVASFDFIIETMKRIINIRNK